MIPLPPPGYGGVEQVLYDLATWLNRWGHEVTVASPKGSTFPDGIAHIPTVEPTWDFDAEWAALPVIQDRLLKEVNETQEVAFDIIHDHSMTACMWGFAENPDIRVCRTVQGPVAPVQLSGPHPSVIACSSFLARTVSQTLGIPVERVYNGIETSRYLFSATKGDRYLFLSRISSSKGVHHAIDIALRASIPLDIVGEDRFTEDPAYVDRVRESARGTTARYVGPVSHEEKTRFLRDAKALLAPSVWEEAFGLFVVEAGVSGVPVIALRKGGIPELVVDGKTGFLCSSVDEMVECLGKEAEIDPQACREHVMRNFTAERMAREYEGLYRRIEAGHAW